MRKEIFNRIVVRAVDIVVRDGYTIDYTCDMLTRINGLEPRQNEKLKQAVHKCLPDFE